VLCPTRGYAHFTISNVEGGSWPNPASYETTAELVVDQITGLVWERHSSPDAMEWKQAKAHCGDLVIEGREDFRLPGRIELVTLLDFDRLPVIASPFEEVVSDYHWTSSAPLFVQGSAYTVYFGAGETTIANADPGRAFTRCVAGEVRAPADGQFELRGDLALDRGSGLLWERGLSPRSSLSDATLRCASSDMRLPSIRELQSIVDERSHAPAIDLQVFPGAEAHGVWSSSLRGTDPWYVDFTDGKTYADRYPDEALASRCVR
jgi:hypothetical protein